MALRNRGPNGRAQFDDAEVPFLLLASLFLRVSGDGWVEVATYQDDE